MPEIEREAEVGRENKNAYTDGDLKKISRKKGIN
jgi:hypothetical protein